MADFTFETDATLLELRSKVPAAMKGLADLTYHNRVVFPMAKRWGSIKTNHDVSFTTVWDAKNRLPNTHEWHDFQPPNFAQGPEPIQFNLPDGSYSNEDILSRMQYERIKHDRTRIVNYYKEKPMDLARSMNNQLNFEILHGDGTGRRITGFDVPLGHDAGNTTSADKVAYPSATYAGQSTVLGTNGTWGAQALTTPPNAALGTDWPEPTQQDRYNEEMSAYHATSPLLVNSSSTQWENGTNWGTNCEEVMRYYIYTQLNLGGRIRDPSAPLTLIMGKERYRAVSEYFSAKGRELIPRKEGTDYGMPEHFEFEGAWLCFDFDVAPDDCYVIQPDVLDIATAMEKIFVGEGPSYVEYLRAYLFQTLAGPMKVMLQPKMLGRIKDYA